MPKKVCNDCNYNIMKQLVKKMGFLWRVDGYIRDAKKCGHKECAKALQSIKKDESRHAVLLRELIVKLAKSNKLN